MTLAIPAWQPFDPSTDGLPAALRPIFSGGPDGHGVVVLAVAPSVDPDWAAAVSVRIAEMFGERGSMAVLVDLDLEAPSLDRTLAQDTAEGISDVLLFGASVHRITRTVRDGAFMFAPAGTVVGDPARIRSHERWDLVLQTYRDRGATVLLHVPVGAPGSEALLERADRMISLAGPGSPPAAELTEAFGTGLVWIGPPLKDEPAATVQDAGTGEGAPASEAGPPSPVSAAMASAVEDSEPSAPDAEDDLVDPLAFDPLEDREPPTEAASLEVLLSESLEEAWDAEPGPEEGSADAATEDHDPAQEAGAVDPFWEGSQDEEAPTGSREAEGPGAAFAAPGPSRPDPTRAAGGGSFRTPAIAAVGVAVVVAAVLLWMRGRGGGDVPSPVETAEVERPAGADPTSAAGDATDEGGASTAGVASAPSEARPEAAAPGQGAGGGGAPTSTPAGPPVLDPATPHMAYGLAVASFETRRREAGESELAALTDRYPEVQFILVPVEVDGRPYVRLLAGPAESIPEAEALRDRLSGYLGQGNAAGAFVRATRMAYLLGEFSDLDEARDGRANAEGVAIPAYLVVVDTNHGPRYRVYAGAFANEAEAAHLGELLAEAGLDGATLVERRGRVPR